ncbi:PilW family protein [Halanaerobium congolense]|jgi:prepilin-type N-terminal cleavage/methylation domain-containing protein|uniref:Prepilin-type N-terminal cleavage/methylation domain-containing protein n=1 Tax=Halanaerobium congolense TaxID=54121 RepID=A0A1G6HX33_9FIRM|nr:type II secretion system protein [Halanaerobium congolense]TDP27062.1 prepilin-type N-terminal cleavage/methylation domain-containing protein [Halanaerobium congolense]SDB98750.1 prepilin-type N-terminal cleavage/methylation domain-containing protein [Halanaerobium congolense]
MRLFKDEQGITLIEVILVIALISIISSAIYMTYTDSIKVWFFNKERVEIQQNHDIVQKWLERYVRQAKTVDYSVDKQLTIEFNESDEILFFLNNGFFSAKINSEPVKQISNLKFQDIYFNPTTDNLVEVTSEIENKKGTKTYNFKSIYYPRLLN